MQKPIDRLLVRVLLVGLAVGLGVVIDSFATETISRAIGTTLGLGYIVFVASHLGLCFPLFFVVFICWYGIPDRISHRVEEFSLVLGCVARTLKVLVGLFLVYLAIPVLIIMMIDWGKSPAEAIGVLRSLLTGKF